MAGALIAEQVLAAVVVCARRIGDQRARIAVLLGANPCARHPREQRRLAQHAWLAALRARAEAVRGRGAVADAAAVLVGHALAVVANVSTLEPLEIDDHALEARELSPAILGTGGHVHGGQDLILVPQLDA